MKERKKKSESEDDSQAWALSYGDMMTLLLTFFVLIVSFSTTELIKFRQAMGSLKGSVGVLLEQDGSSIIHRERLSRPAIMETKVQVENDQNVQIKEKIDEIVTSSMRWNIADGIGVDMREEGVNFRFSDKLLFDIGSAELRPTVYEILDKIGTMIDLFYCEVRVEGHTDNLPIYTGSYNSNWELSSERATSVARYFVEQRHIDPTRIVTVGCGEHRPLLPNTSSRNRAKNRRVEIILNWGNNLGAPAMQDFPIY